MEMQIEKGSVSLGRERMAKRELGKEVGSDAALRLRGASPEEPRQGSERRREELRGRERRKMAKGQSESVKATRNHRSLKYRKGSWAENSAARTVSPHGPPGGDQIHAPLEGAARRITRIRCGALTARGRRKI
jgi:hypothetical protein